MHRLVCHVFSVWRPVRSRFAYHRQQWRPKGFAFRGRKVPNHNVDVARIRDPAASTREFRPLWTLAMVACRRTDASDRLELRESLFDCCWLPSVPLRYSWDRLLFVIQLSCCFKSPLKANKRLFKIFLNTAVVPYERFPCDQRPCH